MAIVVWDKALLLMLLVDRVVRGTPGMLDLRLFVAKVLLFTIRVDSNSVGRLLSEQHATRMFLAFRLVTQGLVLTQ